MMWRNVFVTGVAAFLLTGSVQQVAGQSPFSGVKVEANGRLKVWSDPKTKELRVSLTVGGFPSPSRTFRLILTERQQASARALDGRWVTVTGSLEKAIEKAPYYSTNMFPHPNPPQAIEAIRVGTVKTFTTSGKPSETTLGRP
jgi:hypothetical protein